jgi:putative NADPH-quinone reductase
MLRKTKKFVAFALALIMLFGTQTVIFASPTHRNALANSAAAMEQLNSSDYTVASFARLTVALENAKDVLAVTDAGEAMLRSAYFLLFRGFNALEPAAVTPPPPPPPPPPTPREAVDAARNATLDLDGTSTPEDFENAQSLINAARAIVTAMPILHPDRPALLNFLDEAQARLHTIQALAARTAVERAVRAEGDPNLALDTKLHFILYARRLVELLPTSNTERASLLSQLDDSHQILAAYVVGLTEPFEIGGLWDNYPAMELIDQLQAAIDAARPIVNALRSASVREGFTRDLDESQAFVNLLRVTRAALDAVLAAADRIAALQQELLNADRLITMEEYSEVTALINDAESKIHLIVTVPTSIDRQRFEDDRRELQYALNERIRLVATWRPYAFP